MSKQDINWLEMSNRIDLSLSFIKENKRNLDFSIICKNYKYLPLDFMKSLRKYIDWEAVILYHASLPHWYIEKMWFYIPWKLISRNPDLSYEKITEYAKYLDWIYLSKNRTFGPKRISKYYIYLKLPLVCQYQKLDMDFIESHMVELKPYMYIICQYQKLTVSFMRKYKDKLDWSLLCEYQKMSCAFLEEIAQDNKLDWYCWTMISEYQNITEKFIMDHREDLNIKEIIERKDLKLSDEFFSNPEIKFILDIRRRGLWPMKQLADHSLSMDKI